MKKFNELFEKYHKWLLWVMFGGFALLYLSLCFNNNIWTDEAFTIDLLRNSENMKEAVHGTVIDVHPPLYYIICRLVTNIFGIKLLVLKTVSIVPMIMTMIFGAWFLDKRIGGRSAVMYVLLVGFLPCSMEYAIQVRMYSWAILFVTLCGIGAYEAYYRKKNVWWGLTILAGIGAAYTHYFALVAVAWIYGLLFLVFVFSDRKRLGRWLLAVALSVIGYGPWLSVLLRQFGNVTESYWISEITFQTVLEYFGVLFGTDLPYMTILFCVLLVTGIILAVCRIRREKDATCVFALLCLAVLLGTAASGVLVSILMRPIFIARYLLPCIGLLSMFFAISLNHIDDKVYFVLLCFLVLTGAVVYERTYYVEYKSTYVPQTEAFFEENLGENDIISYNFKAFDFIYEYYWDREKLVYIEDVDFGGDYENIWVMFTHHNTPIPKEKLEDNGWSIQYMGNYGIEHDEFKIYRIYKQ